MPNDAISCTVVRWYAEQYGCVASHCWEDVDIRLLKHQQLEIKAAIDVHVTCLM
jgi:hypothetical protein